MSEGFVCHVRDGIEGAVYIGRAINKWGIYREASPLYNPFIIGYHHDSIPRQRGLSRVEVIDLYRQYLQARPFLIRKIIPLRGKPLECWCRHKGERIVEEKNWCHGDILLYYLSAFTDEELREMK